MLISDPAPIARGGAITPALDPEEGSLRKANPALATAGPALLLANPSRALAPASPGLVRQNASPVRRAVPRWSRSATLAADPRRTAGNTSLPAVRQPQLRTARKNGRPNPRPARHCRMRTTVAPSQGRSDWPRAPSRVQGLARGLVQGRDQLLRIRGTWERSLFFVTVEINLNAVHTELCHPSGLFSVSSLLFCPDSKTGCAFRRRFTIDGDTFRNSLDFTSLTHFLFIVPKSFKYQVLKTWATLCNVGLIFQIADFFKKRIHTNPVTKLVK